MEVLIAIFLLSVGLMAIATLQATAIKTNGAAMEVTKAMGVAQGALEELMRRPYSHSSVSAGDHTEASPPAGYTISWNVTDDNPVTDTKMIHLIVTYPNMKKPIDIRTVKPKFLS